MLRFAALLLLALLTASAPRASSIDGKTVTFTELMYAMLHDTPTRDMANPWKQDIIFFENVTIKFDRAIDDSLDQRFSNERGPRTIVEHSIYFRNCTFDVTFWYVLYNVTFKGHLDFWNCTNMKLLWKNCTFEGLVQISDDRIDFLTFEKCAFQHGMSVARSEVTDAIRFDNCLFSLRADIAGLEHRFEMEDRVFRFQHRGNPTTLEIEHCKFEVPFDFDPTNTQYHVNITKSIFANLRFNNNRCRVPLNTSQSIVDNQFATVGCIFERGFISEAFSFNATNSKLQWSTFNNERLQIVDPTSGKLINGNTISRQSDELVFSTLIAAYANFYRGFKDQGNRLSANACYMEWKDIETIYLQSLLDERYTFQNYFSYLMNVFLKTFCDYGTNPIKAIRWSLWVMLAFGALYFFFPFQSGLYSRERYFQRFLVFLENLTHERPLTELWDEHRAHLLVRDPAEKRFHAIAKKHSKELPFYTRLLWLRTSGLGRWWLRQERTFLAWLDGRHKPSRRNPWYINFIYGATILYLLLYYLILRVFNCATLSLNAFSTLGFGEIPVRGAARYLAILEGFLGWFLLSIFSVALISQIIQ